MPSSRHPLIPRLAALALAARVTGPTFQPPVFAAGKYTIAVGRDKPDGVKLEGVEATADKAPAGTRKVKV